MEKNKFIPSNRPYDLSGAKWVCKKCGGVPYSGRGYEPIGFRKVCMCNK